jgi:hypothetical protein
MALASKIRSLIGLFVTALHPVRKWCDRRGGAVDAEVGAHKIPPPEGQNKLTSRNTTKLDFLSRARRDG